MYLGWGVGSVLKFSQRAWVEFPVPTEWLTMLDNSSPRDPTLSSDLRGHLALEWHACIHAFKTFIYINE